MISPAILAKVEASVRPILTKHVSPRTVVALYSRSRPGFLKRLAESARQEALVPPVSLAKRLWGLEFRSPIGNAAGMFKNGEAYDLVASQGAGFYLAGTTTWNARTGNVKEGIVLPFAPYPRSGAASNWLGLPNDGDTVVAARLAAISRVQGCPIGASVMGSPDFEEEARVSHLIDGLQVYANAGVDFLEINESCPNTAHGHSQFAGLDQRLERIAKEFLGSRTRTLPVIVKFSNDTDTAKIPSLISLLLDLGFDGVNFGNSSVQYAQHQSYIDASERELFDFFTKSFGGGVTGRPLKSVSLELLTAAVTAIKQHAPSREFHVIRTGGIESAEDVRISLAAGASLVQWYTGYFESYADAGNDLYKALYAAI